MFQLPPPSQATLNELATIKNGHVRPADERYVNFYAVQRQDDLATFGGHVEELDPATGEAVKRWVQPAGRPIFKTVEYIEIRAPGDKDNVVRRPVRPTIDPYLYPAKYTAFRNNTEQTTGTPLDRLGVIGADRIAELAHFKIATVDQLADVPDSMLGSLGRGALKERTSARNYLTAMASSQPLADLAAENKRLADRLRELEAAAKKPTKSAEVR